MNRIGLPQAAACGSPPDEPGGAGCSTRIHPPAVAPPPGRFSLPRMIRSASVLCCCCAVLASVGCARRGDPPPPPDDRPPVEPVVAPLELDTAIGMINGDAAGERNRAERRFALVLGDDWEGGGSGWFSLSAVTVDGAIHLIQRTHDGTRARVSRLDGEAGAAWKEVLDFGQGYALAEAGHRSHPDIDTGVFLFRLQGGGEGVPVKLYYAPRADGLILVRATDARDQLALASMSREHPRLRLGPGRLTGDDLVDRLAALVVLSQPSAKDERDDSKTKSILRSYGQRTENWLAEAAVEVSLMP